MFSHHSSEYMSRIAEPHGAPAHLDEEARPLHERGAMEEGLLELEGAWLRAVALCWEDPTQLDRLKSDPRGYLMACCGYAVPPGIELTIREAREPGSPDGDALRFCEQRRGWDPSAGAITLHIPPPPELEDQPVALAELASDPGSSAIVC
ncbi:BMA_0021/BMA_0022 family TOMM bacteriocin [Sorangium sp. So ce327]|uniref:BMA_0021/BMA_0022 family TOMM bacteriocin n=1 Tax=Sorangium sp. So ce327 TaxID=3133301 RepID=UPI003F6242DA